jgi:hypothetical protein
MKKIFGVLSLIAILTVAFSTKAIASDADNVSTEYVASLDAPDFVAVAVADLPTFTLFANPMEVPITNSLANGEVVDSAEIVAGVFSNNELNYANVFLPIEVGLLTASVNNEFTLNNKAPDLNEYVSTFNDKFGYETPLLVKRISANIGKLTTIPLNS